MDLPIGFRFCPSDKVLLSYYLLKKLKGESTQFQIPDVDVYGIEPWSLFNDINDDDEDDDDDDEEATYNNLAYVFTAIKKKHGNNEPNRKKKKHGSGSERISRTVTTPSPKNQAIGTWRDQKAHDIIDMVSKKIIGAKRMLSFVPAPSKQDHDDADNEGTCSNKRKRNHQLDGISYIMHEYSMAGSSYVLCRIRRKISKSRKMNNKKMKYSSSCSKNITRKNTCWEDDQASAEYDQPLHGSRMPCEDDHHQTMTNTSGLLDHNQSSMWQQQQQQDRDAECSQQVQECMPQMMMNTSVLDHDQSWMWQQQQLDQDAGFNYQPIQEFILPMMTNTSVLLDHESHDQSSMWQQTQLDQDAEHDQLLQERIPYDDEEASYVRLLEEELLLTGESS